MRLFRYFLAMMIFVGSGCTTASVPGDAGPVRPDRLTFPPLSYTVPRIEPQVLPSGIRLYLKEDHELPLVDVTVMVGGGSIGDPADKTGQGTLFASALRTGGAAERSAERLEKDLARMAADFSVSVDHYALTLELSSRSEDLKSVLGILADVLRRPLFDPQRLELARRQAVEGIRRRNDEPESIARRALTEAVYPDHPLGREATIESVSAVTRDDLMVFHRRFFVPGNICIGITGDFDPAALVQELNGLFENWASDPFVPQVIPPLTPSRPAAVLAAEKKVPQTTVLFGQQGISKDNPDLHALQVMNYILGGGGFNSRLMREVRSNRGLAYSVYSYFQVGRRLAGMFMAGSETKSGSTLEVVRLMRQEMERMRREPVSEQELRLAKESLINSFVFAFDGRHEVVTQQMRLDFYDYPPDYLQSYRDRIAAVTRDDVLRVARKYLDPAVQTLVLVGDSAHYEGAVEGLGMQVKKVPLE